MEAAIYVGSKVVNTLVETDVEIVNALMIPSKRLFWLHDAGQMVATSVTMIGNATLTNCWSGGLTDFNFILSAPAEERDSSELAGCPPPSRPPVHPRPYCSSRFGQFSIS